MSDKKKPTKKETDAKVNAASHKVLQGGGASVVSSLRSSLLSQSFKNNYITDTVDPSVPYASVPAAPLGSDADAKTERINNEDNFKSIVNNGLIMLDALESQNISIQMANSQIGTLKLDNAKLLYDLGGDKKEIELNNRKIFYENAQLNIIKNIYNIIFIIYWIIYAVLILIVIFTRSYNRFNRYKMLGILTFLTLFPFITSYIARLVYSIMFVFSTLISKNVYNNI